MTPLVSFHRRELFERNALRAVVAGAAAGAAHSMVGRLIPAVPSEWLVFAATGFALAGGSRLQRLVLRALAVVLPAIPWLLGMAEEWAVGLSAAAIGALIVHGIRCEIGEGHSIGSYAPRRIHYFWAAAATAVMGLVGASIADALAPVAETLVPTAIVHGAFAGATLALFAFSASSVAHVAQAVDPTVTEADGLLATITTGELHELARDAAQLYAQCGEELATLPRAAPREALARSLRESVRAALKLAAEWSAVEANLREARPQDLDERIREIEARAASSQDELARRQLTRTAAALREEQTRLAEFRVRRERVLARLTAHVAALQQARIALISVRSAQAQLRAVEVAVLARRFESLARLQSDEGAEADSISTSAVLADEEAHQASRGSVV